MKYLVPYFIVLIAFFFLGSTLLLHPKGEKNDESITALLIIDVQKFYYPGGALPLVNPEAAGQNARKLLEKSRQDKQLVIHVRHNAKDGAEIHPDVQPIDGEKVISKNDANSFKDTDLLDYLKEKHVTRLVICGMQTHMCVEAATRAAYDLGFKCIVIHDACATRALKFGTHTVSAEDVHYSTLASLSRNYADVIDTDTFLKGYK